MQIASSNSSSFVSAALYSSSAVPVFSYLSQFALPDIDLMEEKVAITSPLNLPFTALPLGTLFNLHRWGGVKITSLKVTTIAMHIRAARLTFFEAWQDALAVLFEASAKEFADLPFAQIIKGKPWDNAYGDTPYCWNMLQAFNGDLGEGDERLQIKAALEATISAQQDSQRDLSKNQNRRRFFICSRQMLQIPEGPQRKSVSASFP